MTPSRTLAILLPLILVWAGGCASYRYDVVPPAGATLTVAKDRDLVVPADPASLRVRQHESRCVVIIENPTTQPISLDAAGSAIVDPYGESRSIASQLIPPGSFTKLILPPYDERPRNNSGLQFGIGVMVDAGDLDQPRKAQMLQSNAPKQEYWEWDGEGEIRLILSLKQESTSTRPEMVIRRTKK